MYNSYKPSLDDLPSAEKLKKSTIKAIITATVLLITVVMPAEYAIDITGVGRLLGLKKMGDIKKSLANEAKKQTEKEAAQGTCPTGPVAQIDPNAVKTETMSATIAPDESLEIKAKMLKDGKIDYVWSTEGGALNYNVHGESLDQSETYEYDNGLNENTKSGTIVAEFDGTHGWFWRNRAGQDVKVTVEAKGNFDMLIKK